MRTTVLIDNCVWDLLWERSVNLRQEKGIDLAFSLSPLGTQEIPGDDHPDERARKVGAYARGQLAEMNAHEVEWFCMSDVGDQAVGRGGLGGLQPDGLVAGGGYFTSVEGREYREANQHRIGGATGTKRKKSGLLSNETDVDYGEWSFGLPVVTLNHKDYKGSGTVIDLREWRDGGFGDFIRAQLK